MLLRYRFLFTGGIPSESCVACGVNMERMITMSREDKKILMEGMSQISHLYNLPSEEKKASAQTRGMSTEREIKDMNLLFNLR